MGIIYNLVYLIIIIAYFPGYLFRRKFHSGFLARLGALPKDLRLNNPIWVHAVSVGEAMAISGLVEQLRKAYPGKKIVISTVTPTGNKIAAKIAKAGDFITYLPFDFSFIVRCVIDKIDPCVFIIAETEIWPNLIAYLYKKKIPTFIVNGRISDASFKGYLSIKALLKPVLKKITLFCLQTPQDAQRLLRLGVPQEKIKVTGNMKFDLKDYPDLDNDPAGYRLKMGVKEGMRLFVAGSTHAQEEEVILNVYKELIQEFSGLMLLIAPRHPERAKEVEGLVSKFGFRPVLISGLVSECTTCLTKPVFILDSVGKLIAFYNIADVVFVAGSLIKKGGHNIIEPASMGKPVLFGPYMFNFRDIADLFLNNKAAIMVRNGEELKRNILELLNNPHLALELGERGRGLIQSNQGATNRNLECIRKYIACG